MSEHDYIERCPDCGKFMTWKQMQNHKCTESPSFSVQEIPVLYCCETRDENGDRIFIAHGLDGTMYRLVERNPADEFSHEPQNRRRLHRTRAASVLLFE